MDSLSQLVLGSAIGIAVMGRRTAVWKAALWGGIAGTLPDLDALLDFGDAVRNMTYHRAESHGLFYLSLLAPLMAWAVSKLHGETALFKRWSLALWLALFTHPLLDWFTIYGTQLMQPFSEHPYGLGSMFIIDPIYTFPLLIGVIVALSRKQFAGLRWNALALGFSCLYLAWSAIAQAHVERIVRAQLTAQGQGSAKFFVTPAPLNTIVWRVVVMGEQSYSEGFYSFTDKSGPIKLDSFAHQPALINELKGNWAAERMAWFTHGFYSLREVKGQAILTDLRMGQEPGYVFQFALAQREGSAWKTIQPEQIGNRGDAAKALPWLWARIKGQDVPPPR
ncbi:metal-dependent hydrolase [Variovorax sp. PCZ-1]|uniref:metal-dependent hydrolase n=1 Tax=Variovorax sp. PCZ-1 TaxID=2835533 RepID=UPI001BCE86E5|nr:metal-dependent hydrolase [Variovorax sp. PCZ-1]MBS7806927.1 metal-dependent hydrolase [Variovorax sp. PCZ-1]